MNRKTKNKVKKKIVDINKENEEEPLSLLVRIMLIFILIAFLLIVIIFSVPGYDRWIGMPR